MLPLANDAFTTLAPYVPGKPVSETERELGISGCIKLASNENPLGPSPKAIAAMKRALAGVSDYPDGGAFYLKERLREHLSTRSRSLGVDQIIVGNGTNEIIEMIVRTFVRTGENIIYLDPSFIVYKLCAHAAGHAVVDVAMPNFCFDLDAALKAVDAHTKLVFIANPNNPTGTYVSRTDLEGFLARLPQQVLVGLDEAYAEYVTAPDYPNGLDYIDRRERLIVLRTFSKCYGLAGVRVGYAVAQPRLIDCLNRGRQPFNVNSLGQVAALAALDDVDFVAKARATNASERETLTQQFRRRHIGVVESQANFLLVDFQRSAAEVFTALLQRGVIVRPMTGYGLPTSARITVGTPEQNIRLLAEVDHVINSVA